MKIPLPVTKKRVRIEIIPLIDIVFFLLATFVMVSLSMVKNQGIAVNLPTAASSQAQDLKQIVTITVKEKGDIYLNKALVSFEKMSKELERLRSVDPDVKVLINGDKQAYFGQAIQVLDMARQIGITKVAIRTQTIKDN